MPRPILTLVLLSSAALAAHAQQPVPQPMGTVPTSDALVTGGLEVRGDSARLLTNDSITAYAHTADIALDRGGNVLVCATSQFHLLHSGTGDSLLFGLDRGAIELHTAAASQDVILTPDIRFTLEHPGHYDLSLRVTPNGDTCVDNAGPTAPVLSLADSFSTATYRLIPGQHVLFEHGDLHQVVDNERSSCGCPPNPAPPLTQLATPSPTQPTPPTVAAAQHPFPAAASVGLAPTTPPNNSAPAGEKHTQISTALTYDASHPTPPPSAEPASSTTGASTGSPTGTGSSTTATPPPAPPGAHDLFHAIGHLFHKLFHPHSGTAKTHPSSPSS
ncbi:MAG TPA: nuclease [Acidobacteriaceae bacterium]|jgi:hypothetical protein|nr:nuclease [Acidobacteriaceae bacterium]